ncbi:MAG: aminotransferase class III-fold pyridoxal phosphate-dependent enzyme [Firmicutes bacterium]|nr:aminotransferase class III-fold pyridoxal phosphate-dependent enzyme [Bacillota bacterium]
MSAIQDRYRRSIAGVVPMETSLHISSGHGPYLETTTGERYLDLATGIAVNALGYQHPQVTEALMAQARRHLHLYGGTGYQDVVIDFAEAILATLQGDYQVFFGNSGTEAVEAAIKLSRWSTGRPGIVAFRGAFHGRSLGALSLTASAAKYRSAYEPLLPSVYHIDYPAPTRLGLSSQEALQESQRQLQSLWDNEISPERIAAVVVEPIQGEGGYVIPPEGFLEWLRDVTMQHGILLAVDEVQSGLGRTGRMFAFQHSAIEPDIVIMGKALGGGLPVSAIAGHRELMEAWPAGTHGTTFGGNPLACATGLATLKTIEEEGLLDHAATLGQLALEILAPLKSLSAIADIRGRGLMIAVEFSGAKGPELVAQILHQALEEHIVLHSAGLRHEVIRFMPPLNIDRDLFMEGLRTIVALITAAS